MQERLSDVGFVGPGRQNTWIPTWVWYPKPGGIRDHKEANIRPGLVAPLRFRFLKHLGHGENEAQEPGGEDCQNNLKIWDLRQIVNQETCILQIARFVF